MNITRENITILSAIILPIILLVCMFKFGNNEKDAEKSLVAMGFKEIQYIGYDIFSCAKDDFFRTGFKAKNSNGIEVTGTVCSGLFFKNSTVRFS